MGRDRDDGDRNIWIVVFRPCERRVLYGIGIQIVAELNAQFSMPAFRRQDLDDFLVKGIFTAVYRDLRIRQRFEVCGQWHDGNFGDVGAVADGRLAE